MATINKFSLIVPTYTGADTIRDTFESILMQKRHGMTYEVLVVIDGPSPGIQEAVEEAAKEFYKKSINFKVEQLKKNKGRFDARMVGAGLANNSQLLFVDDRARLETSFFSRLSRIGSAAAIPNVIEKPSNNLISKTLFILRRTIYGNKWGQAFEDYMINKDSFENSPKGTTCLWVRKDEFLQACSKVKKNQGSRYVNEDTKILKEIVDSGRNILRTSKLNIFYQPRASFIDAVRHLYARGPRFVDYYVRPKTRFFPLLIFIYLALLLIVVTIALRPFWLIYYLIAIILGALLLALAFAKESKEYVTLVFGVPLVSAIFTLGVIKGTVLKIVK